MEGSQMKAKIEKRGGELILKIPERVAEVLELEEGTEVELARLGGSLLVTPGTVPTLEDLLEQVTEDNLHGEIETGPPVGREIW
jgi:antitoxin MazE